MSQIDVNSPIQQRPEYRGIVEEYKTGAGKRSRTPDLRITNALLYRLSYSGVVGEYTDSTKSKPDPSQELLTRKMTSTPSSRVPSGRPGNDAIETEASSISIKVRVVTLYIWWCGVVFGS